MICPDRGRSSRGSPSGWKGSPPRPRRRRPPLPADAETKPSRRVAPATENEPMISALAQALRFPSVAYVHKDVLGAFVRRELKARYQGSLLGRLWPVLQPLLQFAVFGFVFAVILHVQLASENSIVPGEWAVVFFMLSGIVPWITFAESTQRGVQVVVENANL